MYITDDIIYAGVNDHQVDLFEGQYQVPNGMAYNSYVIKDEKIAVMDTVDGKFTHEWLDNVEKALAGRKPDYLGGPAYGAGPLGQYPEFYEGLSRGSDRGQCKDLLYGWEFLPLHGI